MRAARIPQDNRCHAERRLIRVQNLGLHLFARKQSFARVGVPFSPMPEQTGRDIPDSRVAVVLLAESRDELLQQFSQVAVAIVWGQVLDGSRRRRVIIFVYL